MKKIKHILITTAAVFAVIFSSCEVGLGSSIDKDPPTIRVTYPPEASVVKGSFVLAGECNDDQKVMSVNVEIYDEKDIQVGESITANVDGNSWSVGIDVEHNKDLYKDGRYTFRAIAVDAAYRTSMLASTSLTIDNTAPVLILNNPQTVEVENSASFGKSIRIVGDISEQNTTTKVILYAQECDEDGNIKDGAEVIEIPATNFKTISTDNPLVFANINDDATAADKENYKSIYGDYIEDNVTVDKDKYFRTTFKAFDNAKTYVHPGDSGTGEGNETSFFYINTTKFNNELLSEDAYNLNATKIRKYLNKTLNEPQETLDKIADVFADSEKNDFTINTIVSENNVLSMPEKTLVINVNPTNSPHYVVSGYIKNGDGEFRDQYLDDDINIDINAGKDGIKIKPKTIKISIKKLSDGEEKVIVAPGDWTDANGTNFGKTVRIENKNGSEFYKAGQSYQILVTGQDEAGNEIGPEKGLEYGFKIFTNSEDPVLEIEALDDYYSGTKMGKNGEGIYVYFTVTTAGNSTGVTVTSDKKDFTLTAPEDCGLKCGSIELVKQSGSDYVTSGSNFKYKFRFKVGGGDSTLSENAKQKYTYNLTVKDSVGKTDKKPFYFYIDKEDPKITVLTKPVVEKEEENNGTKIQYVNGEVKFSARVNDNVQVKTSTYTIKIGDTPVTSHNNKAYTSEEVINFDTFVKENGSLKYDGKDLTVTFNVTDVAGNPKEEVIGPFRINQDTDKPVINAQNFYDKKTSANVKANSGDPQDNIFAKGSKLIGSVNDSDGISSISYKIGNNTEVPLASYISGQVFNIPLPNASGLYKINITAKDKTYNKTETEKAPYRKVEQEFYVAVDSELPKLAITKIGEDTTNLAAVKNYINSVDYEGTASDDWEIDTIQYKIVQGKKEVSDAGDTDWLKPATAITPDASGKWSYTVNLSAQSDDNYTVFFKVTDKAGKSKIVNSYICKDANAPTLSELKVDGTKQTVGTVTWYKNKELAISGKVADSTSGVATVEYSLDPNATEWTPLNVSNGAISGTVTGLTDNCTIYVRAQDNAGNLTGNQANKIENIRIDCDAPVITVTSFGETTGSENTYKGQIVMNGTKEIIIKGTITDAGSGVKSIIINGTPVTPSNDKWTYTLPKATESGNIQCTVADQLDNSSTTSLFQVVKDNTPPTVKITKVVYEGTENAVTQANGNITFEGIANDTDNFGIKAVKLQYALKGTTAWAYCGTATDDLNNWTITVNTADSKFTDTSIYNFRAVATDLALNNGNSAPAEYEVNKDSDRPEIKFNFDLTPDMTVSAPAWLVKTRTLSYSVTDDDGTPTTILYDIGNGFVNGSSGKINLLEDKIYTIKFKITDKAGTTFESSTDLKPKLVGENGVNTSDTLYLGIDMTPPDSSELKFHILGDANNVVSAQNYWITSIDNRKVGGTANKVKITLKAKDDNGIKEVIVKRAKDENETYTLTCADENYKDANNHVWTTADAQDIDVSDLTFGSESYMIHITDNAGLTTVKNININVDNVAPVLRVTSPEEGIQLGNEFTIKGSVSDTDVGSSFQVYVSKDRTLPDDFDWDADLENKYNYTLPSITSWRIYVDGATADDSTDGIHIDTHKKLFVNAYKDTLKITMKNNKVVYNNENGALSGNPYVRNQPLYFFFNVKDSVGNSSVTEGYKLNIDPQGDLPTVAITSPVPSESESNYDYAVLSGNIRVQGNAEAKEGKNITAVYMQIDPNYNPSTGFNVNAWKTKNTAKALKGPKENAPTIGTTYGEANIVKIEGADEEMYGIKIAGENTSSWNYEINKNDDLIGAITTVDGKSERAINKIAVRVIATDSAGNVTVIEAKNDLIIHIDTEAPGFGISEPFYVYQFAWKRKSDNAIFYTKKDAPATGEKMYTDAACVTEATGVTFATENFTNEFRSQIFENDMWLKGIWWLKGSVEDQTEISKIEIKENGSDEYVTVVENKVYVTNNSIKDSIVAVKKVGSSKFTNGNSGYVVYYKVGSTNGAGNLSYEIKATDSAAEEKDLKSASKTFSINYDNVAPVVELTTGANYEISANVVNSDGYYSLGSAAYEEGLQSGFARTVFFFTKDYGANNANKKIYDAYRKYGTNGNAIDYSGKQDAEDHIYYVTSTIESAANSGIVANKVKFTNSINNLNIHKGSLIKLAGAYYNVTKITRSTSDNSCEVELDKNPSASLVGATAKIAIGNVVNNDTKEKVPAGSKRKVITDDEGYGYFDVANNDDFMIESAETIIGTTIWSAKINSNNIPDGPAKLHYVVFDKAGNVSDEKLVDVLVKNNAPRFASLHVWCDYDGSEEGKALTGDNKATEKSTGEESADFYVAERQRRIKDAETGVITRVAKSQSTTENMVVGKVNAVNEKNEDGTSVSFVMVAKDDMYFVPEIVGGNGDLYYDYKVGAAATYTNGAKFGEGKNYETQYKEDENGDPYYDGESSSVIKLAKNTLGENSSAEAPTQVYFKIWDSALGSTLRDAEKCLSATMQIAVDVKVNDIAAPTVKVDPLFWEDKDNNSLYKNNKAYGHIELKNDLNNAIKNTEKNDTTALGDDDDKVSGIITIRGTAEDYNRIGELQVKFGNHSEISGFNEAATYSKGVWTSASADDNTAAISDNMKNKGWTFSAKDVYNNRNGHKVEWECNIDTSFITGIADIDQTFEVKAIDTANKNNAASNNTLKVDVVPYVYRLATSLSSADLQNPSIYDRSTSGHYPVYQGEKIQIVGFNFAKNNTSKEYTVGANAVSGSFDPSTVDALKVNGIPVLNNINKDKAGLAAADVNDESKYQQYAYNRCANGANNNKLTDDLYLDVWKINPTAANASDNMILDAFMKINPSTNKYGFAYADGNLLFTMATKNDEKAVYTKGKDFFTCIGFAYDQAGNAWGLTLGGENGDNYGDGYFLLSSLWGTDTNKFAYQRSNTVAIEANTQRGTKGQTSGTYSEFLHKKRFASGSIATSPNNDSTEYVNIAYYDKLNGEIRFRTGVIGQNKEDGTILQNYKSIGNSKNTYPFDSGNNLNNGKYDATKVQILADGNGNGLGYAGEYLALGTLPSDGHVIITWYDSENKVLRYSYKTAAGSNYKGTNVTDWKKWNGKGYPLLEHAGEYCQLVVDKNNGIHIACYDRTDMALKYVYIKDYTKPEEAISCTVDSYLKTGMNLTIDVAMVEKKDASGNTVYVKDQNGNPTSTAETVPRPYIGFWRPTPSRAHYAYLVDPQTALASGGNLDGVDGDKFTGVWEVTVVPTSSTVFVDDYNPWRINVGVAKNSTTGVLSSVANGIADNKNAVLGYIVESSTLGRTTMEVAQLTEPAAN